MPDLGFWLCYLCAMDYHSYLTNYEQSVVRGQLFLGPWDF